MICDTVGYIVALLLPTFEPIQVIKQECWEKVNETDTQIEYKVIESFYGVEIIDYNPTTDTYIVKLK